MRDFEGFQLQTVADDPELADRIQAMVDRSYPTFVTQSTMPQGHTLPFDWFGIYARWPNLQYVLIDRTDGGIVAACNALTLAWDGPAEELPDEGWNWAMHQAVLDLQAGRKPTMGSALSVTIDLTRRGQHLSSIALRAMKRLMQESGVDRFFAPVRPTTKALYPITPMAEFMTWRNAEGLPLDPWLRVHVRLGGRIIKACNRSQPLAGRVAQWEEWLDLPLPASGEYVAPELLSTLRVDYDADEGVTWEPNVWVVHPLT